MLTWNRSDSTPLSTSPQAPIDLIDFSLSNFRRTARGEIWQKRSEKKKKPTKTTKMRTKVRNKINTQIKKPHLKKDSQ